MNDEQGELSDKITEAVQKSAARAFLKRFVHRYDCATPEQYSMWVKAVRHIQQHIDQSKLEPGAPKETRSSALPIVWFCTDCTPEYQAKMVGENRCLHPEVAFRADKDGFIEGHLPEDFKRKLRAQARRNGPGSST